jgi:hypothetical protein
MSKNRVLGMGYAAVFKTLGFGGLGGAFLVVLYFGFIRLLWEVRSVALVGDLLISKLLALGFLTMFTMVIFSSILVSLTTLFFAKDLSILMHSPLSYRTIFLFKTF